MSKKSNAPRVSKVCGGLFQEIVTRLGDQVKLKTDAEKSGQSSGNEDI